ncbi:MAG: sulfite exporter TauE/SafE family protein [Proteobacteria bacterium]|nr:sulfite exporter TauE/SafE family protein [Pseudomonadota bacterium]
MIIFGHSIPIVLGMAAAICTGGIIKGITGIGLPVVTMVIVINFVDPKTALALIVMAIVVTNIWQGVRAEKILEPIKRFWLMLVVFIAALWVGAQIVAGLDRNLVLGIVGLAVVIFAGSNLWRPPVQPLGPVAERVLGPVAGVLGGLLGGMTTIWGPPLMMFLFTLKLSKDAWVQTVGVLWLVGAVPLAAFYWQNGVLNPDTIWLSLAACIPAMIGIWIGERIRTRINEEWFRKILLIALVLIGLNLIRRAFF